MPGLGRFFIPQLCSHPALDNLLPPMAPALEIYGLARNDKISLFLDLLSRLDENCNMPRFRELPFAKLNALRSHTRTLIYEHQTLSVLCDFLY